MSSGVMGGGVGGVSAPSDPSSGGSAGNSTTDLIENTTPPLVIISSRVKSSGALAGCVNEGVAVVRYNFESTNLGKLLQLVQGKLKGRPALSVALILEGSQSALRLCPMKMLSELSLREDREVRQFLKELVEGYLYSGSQYARVDLLLCPLANSLAGDKLQSSFKQLVDIPVYVSPDILGACIPESEGSIPIGTLYFDRKLLKEHWSQPQTMALFERIKTVGKGSYGAAVLYRKKDDNSLVVLKEINLMELSKQERSLALNEVQILSMLDHPNIISYYDNFEEEGVLMIEMEYADGGTLAQFLRQQATPIPEQDILHMFYKMVDALRYLHDHKILHRDLKTANIFLMKEGDVKLGDFGISKVLTATNAEANTVLGTPFYISPEICEGKSYNAKSDIWALGCILYEMACLERTFEGTNLPAVIHKIVQGSFAPIRGGYSDGFRQLVVDMLQREPEARPSASDLYTQRVPELVLRENVEEEGAEEPPDVAKTKSFLYHLDCQSFLLRAVPTHTIKALIDHVSVGYGHVLAVTYDHAVFSWGEGGCGQLGHGDTLSHHTPQLVEALKNRPIIRVECGGEFSIFISDNRIIMSCGRGDSGALGHGPASLGNCTKPKIIEELLSQDTVGVACGQAHVVAITSEGGGVFTWGDGKHGCLGNGKEDMCPSPQEVSVKSADRMKEVISSVRCGLDGTMFLTETGRIYACGNNQYNKLGLNQRQTFLGLRHILNKAGQLQVQHKLVPTPLKELGKHRIVDMSIGPTHSSLVSETGKVFTFGRNSEGQLCSGSLLPATTPVTVRGLPGKPTMVTCSELSTIVTTQENSFLVWGSRPLIKSPLHSTFARSDSTPFLRPLAQRRDSDVSMSPTRRVSFEVGSEPPGPAPSTGGHTHPSGGPTHPIPTAGGSRERLHKSSSLNLSHLPHTMTPCHDPTHYMETLSQLLPEPLHGGRGEGGGVGRRGPSVSSECGGSLEGVVLEPTSIDLVGRCGLLSELCAQGLQQAKLEGVSHFAGNVLILIEAKIPEEKHLKVAAPKQPLLMMSKRLTQKRHWAKRRRLTPAAPEFNPLLTSELAPNQSARLEPTRARSDSEPKELHLAPPPPLDQAHDEDLEESKVPTWILNEEKLATEAAKPRPLTILSAQPNSATPTSTKSRPKNFAITPDASTPKLLQTPPPLSVGVATPLSPTPSVMQGKQIAAEPVRLPAPRNLRSATSTSSLASKPALSSSKASQKFTPLNVKKSQSQTELGRRSRGGKPPSLSKQSSLSQVARVSRGSLQQGSSAESVSSAASSNSSNSPLIHHRKISLPSQATPTRREAPPTDKEAGKSSGPPLPKLALRKSPPKQQTASSNANSASSKAIPASSNADLASIKANSSSSNSNSAGSNADSSERTVKKTEREIELEGEIEKLKGDLAKQQNMLKENFEIMKTLQQQFQELQQNPTTPSSPPPAPSAPTSAPSAPTSAPSTPTLAPSAPTPPLSSPSAPQIVPTPTQLEPSSAAPNKPSKKSRTRSAFCVLS